ncbi:hypothetical protein [Deinococcus wulumuqiensis]|uniref:Uncharacterized protein n=1 Tax=Deinococcus wulumuqiensis TaxID=980427 RepID=A0AAV4K406_9DEIO|nr:hypothetical protein [Deinococcus wulumuqiensis]QII19374.1 hypothetical protein G6R31_00305 [Deinococcus wulumuqiensis R12]GGI77216.1 hypothetical protein GCM10010914_09380 [Deinococcus wulumuqiensis]GGP30730.1 hypothetical protein GCM10008021_23810 [Deinococcus wulumuqiensis]
MTKILWRTTLVLALAGGMVGAQTWQGSNGTYALSGCYQTKDGVRCDFVYSVRSDSGLTWVPSSFETVTPDGGNLKASAISVGGKPFERYGASVNAYRGVPVKLSVLFDLPKTQNTFRVLTISGERVDNVPIRSTTGAQVASAPTTAANLNIAGNWTATLTNCKQSAANTVVCTATLRK